jgi:hypothetical protein
VALQTHLKSRSDRPVVVDPKAKRKAGEGTVKGALEEGEVFLRRGDSVHRLTWAAKDRARGRHLPAGDYTLAGYRIVKGTWHLSATGGQTKLQIKEGKTTKLTLDSSIRIKVHARRKGRGLSLGMGIRGDKKCGLSIYREGKRIPVEYQLLFSGERPPASGAMNYG